MAAVAVTIFAVLKLGDQPSSAGTLDLQGVTDGGTTYRFAVANASRADRAPRVCLALSVSRRDAHAAQERWRLCRSRSAEFLVETGIYCGEPRETLLFGHVPARVSKVEFEASGTPLSSARVTGARRHGLRLYFVSLGGIFSDLDARARDARGDVVMHKRLSRRVNPCADDLEGGAGWYGTYP